MRYTAALRQKIVEDFALSHNGQFDAALFLEEVKEQGPTHPAYDWFEFDRDKAANEHNLWQARVFARGLKVKFEVIEVGRTGPIRVSQSAPLVISPLAGRGSGGGYFLTNPNDQEHIVELCHQAANALASWMARYSACLPYAGVPAQTLEQVVRSLEDVKTTEAV